MCISPSYPPKAKYSQSGTCALPSNPPKTKYSHSGTCADRPLTLLKLNILTLGHVHIAL